MVGKEEKEGRKEGGREVRRRKGERREGSIEGEGQKIKEYKFLNYMTADKFLTSHTYPTVCYIGTYHACINNQRTTSA